MLGEPRSVGAPAAGRAVAFAALAAGAGFAAIATFTQPRVLALGATDVAPLFIGYTVTALAVRLGLGTFIDRWGRRRTAFTALSLKHQIIPPTINHDTPDPECAINVVGTEARQARMDHALSNSFGFGGTNVSLLLSRV